MKTKQTNEKNPSKSPIPNKSQNSLPGAKHKANYNTEFGDILDEDFEREFEEDVDHTISKGNKNQDIRFNSNKNRKEIDNVTSENQLR